MIAWELLYWGGVIESGNELATKGRQGGAVVALAGALLFIMQEEGICSG